MRFKRLFLSLTVVCFSLCATGCGDKLYTMTQEEETIVSLYAAKMVTKFNKNQTTGICNARVRPGELDEAYGITEEEEEEETLNNSDTSIEADGQNSDGATEDILVDTSLSLSEAIGIEGMEFNCFSIDASEEYQVSDSFVLTKTSGKSYIVAYIYGTNNSNESIDFTTVESRDYKLSVNNSAFASPANTFSDYDLTLYDGVVEPEETISFVLVFQVNSSSINEDMNIELQVESNGVTRGTRLNMSQQ